MLTDEMRQWLSDYYALGFSKFVNGFAEKFRLDDHQVNSLLTEWYRERTKQQKGN